MIYDCIVVGAGPAGITAAIQLKRSGCSVLLLEKNEVGGLLRNARRVENCPGFPGGISGAEFVERLEAQLKYFNIETRKAEVGKILRDGRYFDIRTNEGMFRARNVIVATGTRPKKAGIPGEEELAGERVFYDIADLPLASSEKRVMPSDPALSAESAGLYRGTRFSELPLPKSGKTVLIIGGGDCGFDYALNLRDQGHYPVIVTRGEAQCLPLLRKEAEERGIPCHEHVIPEEIREEGSEVLVLCSGQRFSADAVLIAVGREPNLPPMPREIAGLYIVGDARGGSHRQVSIAAGDALCAAMKVAESLRNC